MFPPNNQTGRAEDCPRAIGSFTDLTPADRVSMRITRRLTLVRGGGGPGFEVHFSRIKSQLRTMYRAPDRTVNTRQMKIREFRMTL